MGFQLEALEALLDDAERAFAASGEEPYEDPAGWAVSVLANVPAGIAFLRASLARLRGDAPLAVGYNRQALAEPLTEREMDVLRLIAAGRSNQQIAHDLVVALDTVKKHVTHVLGKLGAANRTEAAARARELGLIP